MKPLAPHLAVLWLLRRFFHGIVGFSRKRAYLKLPFASNFLSSLLFPGGLDNRRRAPEVSAKRSKAIFQHYCKILWITGFESDVFGTRHFGGGKGVSGLGQ